MKLFTGKSTVHKKPVTKSIRRNSPDDLQCLWQGRTGQKNKRLRFCPLHGERSRGQGTISACLSTFQFYSSHTLQYNILYPELD